MEGVEESKMESLLHLPYGIKWDEGHFKCTEEGNSHLGKDRTPQSKNVHEGSSFKGAHLKNSPTAGPSY